MENYYLHYRDYYWRNVIDTVDVAKTYVFCLFLFESLYTFCNIFFHFLVLEPESQVAIISPAKRGPD